MLPSSVIPLSLRPLHLVIALHSLLVCRRHLFLRTWTRLRTSRLHKARLLSTGKLCIQRAAHCAVPSLLLWCCAARTSLRAWSILWAALLNVVVCDCTVAALWVLIELVVGRLGIGGDDVPGV